MRTAANAREGRMASAFERAADCVRLLAWAAMAGGYGLMLWALSESAYADGRTAARRVTAAAAAQAAHETAGHPERPGGRP
ncbi:MAG: hypothetical protein F4222_00775 [Gammaproteobacteria bacterium]|nr:hypothetical protein [Gammaproteobacteria bacterium]